MRLKKSISKSNNVTYSIIKDYTNLKGKRSTCIYELLGNIDSLKERFGEEDTFNKLQEYIDSLNLLIKEGKELPVNITLDPNKRIEKNVERVFFSGHIFLRKVYYDLKLNNICKNIKEKYKITFDINSILECLIYSRIIWPASKNSTFNQSRKFIGNYNFEKHQIYRALSYFAKEMDMIQKELFNQSNKILDRDYKVVYYDCTNYFFYTEENDFQRYGISKQHQPFPLVQMGLFMDADGYPIAMNINPGNTAESKTMLPTEQKILDNFDLKGRNLVVCTDAAMCNDDIKSFNVKDGRGFVITQSIKKLSNELKEFALNKKGWRILGNLKDIYDLETVDDNFKKEHYETIFYKEIECETKSVKQALIITFSYKYQEYQHKIKKHQYERAEKLIEEINKKNKNIEKKKDKEKIKISNNPNDPKRFVKETRTTESGEKAENIEYSINKEKFDDEEKYNGLYGITTNLNNETSEILKVIKGRWEIEESFEIMKDDFDSGTVYLSREDRIKGHFITCFLALFTYRYLEHKLDEKYTVYQIVSKLKEMQMLEQKGQGYQPLLKRDNLSDDLNNFLGINIDNEIITYKKIKKIFSDQSKR